MTAPYYAELEAQPRIAEALLEWYNSSNKAAPSAYVLSQVNVDALPEIAKRYISLSGLQIANAKFFDGKAGFLTIIHKDADGRKCALNIPVDVPQTPGVGMMCWYESLPHWQNMVHKKEGSVWLRMPGPEYKEVSERQEIMEAERLSQSFVRDVEPVAVQQLLKPSVHSVENWHRVDNTKSTTGRLILSVRFVENPELEEIAKRFRNIKTLC
jgi:hypothetical protein